MTGQDNVVGTATQYSLDGPGFELRWGWVSPHLSKPPPRPTQPPVQCVPRLFPEVKRRGQGADHPPPSSANVVYGYSYTSTFPYCLLCMSRPEGFSKRKYEIQWSNSVWWDISIYQIQNLLRAVLLWCQQWLVQTSCTIRLYRASH
jgi:hypothetical protein